MLQSAKQLKADWQNCNSEPQFYKIFCPTHQDILFRSLRRLNKIFKKHIPRNRLDATADANYTQTLTIELQNKMEKQSRKRAFSDHSDLKPLMTNHVILANITITAVLESQSPNQDEKNGES